MNEDAIKQKRSPLFSERDKANLKWFWTGYLRGKALWLLFVFGLLSLQGLVYQQFLTLTETGLRVIFDSGDVTGLIRVCIIVFLLFLVRGALSYIVPRLSAWLASDAIADLRRDMISHLLRLDLSYFDRRKVGETILRLVNQADDMSLFVGSATTNAVRDAIAILVVSGYLIYKSPLLFISALVLIPAVALTIHFVSHRIKLIQKSAENAMGSYINTIEEMSNGMRTVKMAGQEERERIRLFDATAGIRDLSIRLQSAQALAMPALDLASGIAYVLVIGGGGYMVTSGHHGLDAAGIITFLLGLTLLLDPLRRCAQFFTMLQANLIILESLHSLLQEHPTIKDLPAAAEVRNPNGDITLRDVSFSYPNGRLLFEDLNMTLECGQTTAIVGATGSGKTSLLSLITRLYEIQRGEISIGGQNIGDIKVKALRNIFSVVAQDIVIFNASIMDNIRYVRPEATHEEVWAAAEAAEIADLIRERGEAPLGPKGSQLSGGQKQRVGIARAILQDAPVLLLDEATSALDQTTEDRIRVALRRAAKGRTTVMIAHRLSTITHAERIYVLDFGKVVEDGTHSELLAKDGLYAAMYRSQKTGYA
jgi:ATP-binding cassette subfamily B protein/subfamily B ATP-binding cassette protein MsbA